MTNFFVNRRSTGCSLAAASVFALASCSQQPPAPATPTPSAPATGRYQIAAATEGERGATLVLLDTTSGETWYFHPPAGPLYNGFWGDIPRVTSPGETWRQAFQTMVQTPATNRPATIPTIP
jgi:hypothetical protein